VTTYRTDKTTEAGNFFTRVDNRVIDDPELSPLAKLALIYLLSKSDDWQLIFADLKRYLGVGDNQTKKIIAELTERDYINRSQKKDVEKKRFGRCQTDIFEIPELNPYRCLELKPRESQEKSRGLSSDIAAPDIAAPERRNLNHLPTTKKPTTEKPTTKKTTMEGENAPASVVFFEKSLLDIYLEITGIKHAERIPGAVLHWMQRREEDGFFPEPMRAAIVMANNAPAKQGDKPIFDVNYIDKCYLGKLTPEQKPAHTAKLFAASGGAESSFDTEIARVERKYGLTPGTGSLAERVARVQQHREKLTAGTEGNNNGYNKITLLQSG
jgi:hypothetical protein